MVRYEDCRGVVIFRAAIAVEFIYQSAAENLIQIGHVLESSRKFRTRCFSRKILHGKAKQKHTKSKWRLSTKRPSHSCCTRAEQR